MTNYPILVERYDAKHPADLAVCLGKCGREWIYDPSEGDPHDLCLECACGGAIDFKYLAADKCGGCGSLGFYPKLNGCCSRKCMLQAEYAASLEARSG